MRKKLGVFCLLLGFCCLLAAVGFVAYNRVQENRAGEASDALLQDIRALELTEESPGEGDILPEMPTAQVKGYDCIGILSIPVLDVELPVLTDWSYSKLQLAPCLYYGSYFEPNFVIAAHNYRSHFGLLDQLLPGDAVLFTDMTGTVHCYEVVLLETLPGNATQEMISSGFDLSLYTCTSGGGSRVTLRCRSVSGI